MKTQCFVLISLLLSTSGYASQLATVSFTSDNDAPFGTDSDYTNGLFVSYTTGKLNDSARSELLSLSTHSLDKVEFVLGQKMYTPDNISSSFPIANDRPYAGFLYSEVNYLTILPERMSRYNVTLGTVGENSLAQQAQRLVHDMTDSEYPNGWEFQVDEGLVANLGYLNHYAWNRTTFSNSTQFELANVSEVNIGNFRSDVSTGLMFRWGEYLSSSIGAANIDSGRPFRAGYLGKGTDGWFAFTGLEARYRFNDITIEGDRPGIADPENYPATLEKGQATLVAGFTWYNANFGGSFTATINTNDYKEAIDSTHGSASLSLFFFL